MAIERGLVQQARCCHARDDLAICLGKEASLKPSKSGSHPKRAENHGSNHEPWFGLAWLAQFGQTAAELNQTEPSRAMTALTEYLTRSRGYNNTRVGRN